MGVDWREGGLVGVLRLLVGVSGSSSSSGSGGIHLIPSSSPSSEYEGDAEDEGNGGDEG